MANKLDFIAQSIKHVEKQINWIQQKQSNEILRSSTVYLALNQPGEEKKVKLWYRNPI